MKLEAIVGLLGFLLLTLAVSAFDWRIGVALLGIGLIISVLELPRVAR